MSIIRIYRIDKLEDPYKGPFIFSSVDLNILANTLDCQDPNDMPMEDGPELIMYDCQVHSFAFVEVSDLLRYFDESMRIWLDRDGFVLSVYDINEHHVIFGKHQCVFDIRDGRRNIFPLINNPFVGITNEVEHVDHSQYPYSIGH